MYRELNEFSDRVVCSTVWWRHFSRFFRVREEKALNINFLGDIIFNRIEMIDDMKLFIVIKMQRRHEQSECVVDVVFAAMPRVTIFSQRYRKMMLNGVEWKYVMRKSKIVGSGHEKKI